MDVLYIPQLDEGDAGESPTAGRYRLLKREPLAAPSGFALRAQATRRLRRGRISLGAFPSAVASRCPSRCDSLCLHIIGVK